MEILSTLGISWQLLLAQIVNFSIVLIILTKLVYRPLLKRIDERREAARHLAEESDRAERAKRELDETIREKLRQTDKERGKLLEAAKKQAETLQEEILAKARQEADRVLERGRATLEQERRSAQVEVQDTIARVVIQLTEKLLRREFSEKDQKAVLKELSAEIPALMS